MQFSLIPRAPLEGRGWYPSAGIQVEYNICRWLPPDRTWHKANDPKADYSGDFRGGEGRALAEARTLLVCAAHWPTKCNVGLMSRAGLGPKSGSRHGCRVIAWTRQQGLVLYIEDKGVNVAARLPESGRAEAGSLLASHLPLISIPHPARMPDGPTKAM